MARINLLIGYRDHGKQSRPVILYAGPSAGELREAMTADTSCVRFEVHFRLPEGLRRTNPRHPSVKEAGDAARAAAHAAAMEAEAAANAAAEASEPPEIKAARKSLAAANARIAELEATLAAVPSANNQPGDGATATTSPNQPEVDGPSGSGAEPGHLSAPAGRPRGGSGKPKPAPDDDPTAPPS